MKRVSFRKLSYMRDYMPRPHFRDWGSHVITEKQYKIIHEVRRQLHILDWSIKYHKLVR